MLEQRIYYCMVIDHDELYTRAQNLFIVDIHPWGGGAFNKGLYNIIPPASILDFPINCYIFFYSRETSPLGLKTLGNGGTLPRKLKQMASLSKEDMMELYVSGMLVVLTPVQSLQVS